MRGRWTGLGLLLVVPWLTDCVSGRRVRLETGEGPTIVYTPPAAEPPPVEIPEKVFLHALADLLLEVPLTIYPRHQGQVLFASWSGQVDKAQQFLLDQCEPSESPDDCLRLPSNAPPPGTLARMRLALSSSLDSLWEGATIPMAEYADPMAFKVMVYSAMITYLVILMVPEPVTKALAAVLTVCLVAYIGLGPVWSMMKAGWQLVQDCEQATTPQQLKLAGQRFNLVMGDNVMRIFLLLATAAIGGRTSFLSKGPRLPGFRHAAIASETRTGVNLSSVGEVHTVVLAQNELIIGLAPTAVAAAAMSNAKPAPGTSLMANQSTQGPARPSAPSRHRLQHIEEWRKPRFTENGRIIPYNGTRQPPNPIINFGQNRAGKTVTNGQYSLRFDKDGFPEFETRFETLIEDVHIGSGRPDLHFKAANQRLFKAIQKDSALAGELGLRPEVVKQLPTSTRPPPGYSWHHHQDVGRMQLVPESYHRLSIPHTGGMAIWGGGQ